MFLSVFISWISYVNIITYFMNINLFQVISTLIITQCILVLINGNLVIPKHLGLNNLHIFFTLIRNYLNILCFPIVTK